MKPFQLSMPAFANNLLKPKKEANTNIKKIMFPIKLKVEYSKI